MQTGSLHQDSGPLRRWQPSVDMVLLRLHRTVPRKPCQPNHTTHVTDSLLQGWTSVLARNLSLPPHSFLAGGFAEDPTSAAPMTTVSIIEEGIETTGAVKLFAQVTPVVALARLRNADYARSAHIPGASKHDRAPPQVG
jgi:hypothetical protein